MNNATKQQTSCSKLSQSTTAYFRNRISNVQSVKKPNNPYTVPPSMKYPLNKLPDYEQNISSESRSSFLSLSSYNNLIIANLQKDYSSSNKSQVSYPNSEICGAYDQQIQEVISRNHSYALSSDSYDTMQIDHDDDGIDDDILMTIMDLDPDFSSSVTNSMSTNTSSFTSNASRRSSGMCFSSQYRRRSYCNAAA